MNYTLNTGALDTNRKGRLTLFQAIGLIPWVLFGAFLFLSGIGMVGIFIYNLMTQSFGIFEIILVAIMLLGGGGTFMWFGYLLGGKLLIDLLLGQVRQIEGPGMKYSAASNNNGIIYYYSVGEQNFQIPSYGTYKKLYDANYVTAYYLPRSKTLVNLESSHSQSSSYYDTPRGAEQDEELNELLRLEEAERNAKARK